MKKSKINRKKIISFLIISFLVILGTFNLPIVYAIHEEGDGATVYPDAEHPIRYAVFIPEPNMYTTMSIGASSQGRFGMLNWQGGEDDFELVDIPGEDISVLYPRYFDNYLMDSTTNNEYINPWDIDWINVTALNPLDVNMSSYTLNSVFNYYVMIEGNQLQVPLNHSIPMHIDIVIENQGPKVLKTDWLTDDPSKITQSIELISPSGKLVDFYEETVHAVSHGIDIFDYLTFVAHEPGTYRLLVNAKHSDGYPAFLTLEFLKSTISSLSLEELMFGGNSGEILMMEEIEYSSWQSNWFRINGKKGDIYRFELNEDYTTGVEPIIRIWTPCENGYTYSPTIGVGPHDIYFPTNDYAYVSFVDADYGDWYRYLLYLTDYETINYNIGDNTTIISINRDEGKILDFSVQEDTFIKFNFTTWEDPTGNPELNSLNTMNAFIFQDSKKLGCYDKISPLHTETVDSTDFHYYYLPAGNYKGIFRNSDETNNGVIEIDSKYINMTNTAIPINSLTYPDIYPSTLTTVDFQPDDYYSRLKEAQWFGINITEPGQLFFNTTILATDNLAEIPTLVNPSAFVFYNSSDTDYYDYTSTVATPNQSFPIFTLPNDEAFIGFPNKWHHMHFNFTQMGENDGGQDLYPYVWHDDSWYDMDMVNAMFDEFESNETWIFDFDDPDYIAWEKGCDFDLPSINEEEYYWLRIYCNDGYGDFGGEIIPFLDLIQLSNITIHGNLKFALIKDSGYEHCDFWEPTPPFSFMGDVLISQESGYNISSIYAPFLRTTEPYIVGVEPGFYKLLVVPDGWSHSGSLNVRFGISDFKGWAHETFSPYIITKTPLIYPYNISNGVVAPPIAYNYSTYPFEYSPGAFNNTFIDCPLLGRSYFFIECIGTAYQWTQLVVATYNVSLYDIWIMQDLPWINNNGPNYETRQINNLGPLTGNNTIEFGVLNGNFTLIIVFDELLVNETVNFNIDLSQYNTTVLTANSPVASYTPPTDSGPWILVLAISIPVVAGIIVVVYILKRKGRILTKHPG